MPRGRPLGRPGEGYSLSWEGRKFVQYVDEKVQQAMEQVRGEAERYWREDEWQRDRHPEMTGNERDQATFEITPHPGGVTVLIIGTSVPHAIYEELGTAFRSGHHPLHNTLDHTAPRIAPALRRAFRSG